MAPGSAACRVLYGEGDLRLPEVSMEQVNRIIAEAGRSTEGLVEIVRKVGTEQPALVTSLMTSATTMPPIVILAVVYHVLSEAAAEKSLVDQIDGAFKGKR